MEAISAAAIDDIVPDDDLTFVAVRVEGVQHHAFTVVRTAATVTIVVGPIANQISVRAGVVVGVGRSNIINRGQTDYILRCIRGDGTNNSPIIDPIAGSPGVISTVIDAVPLPGVVGHVIDKCDVMKDC